MGFLRRRWLWSIMASIQINFYHQVVYREVLWESLINNASYKVLWLVWNQQKVLNIFLEAAYSYWQRGMTRFIFLIVGGWTGAGIFTAASQTLLGIEEESRLFYGFRRDIPSLLAVIWHSCNPITQGGAVHILSGGPGLRSSCSSQCCRGTAGDYPPWEDRPPGASGGFRRPWLKLWLFCWKTERWLHLWGARGRK